MSKAGSTPAFQAAAHLRAVLDLAVDDVIVLDKRGSIDGANPAAEWLFDYSANVLALAGLRCKQL